LAQFLNIIIFIEKNLNPFLQLAHFFDITIFVGKINFVVFFYTKIDLL